MEKEKHDARVLSLRFALSAALNNASAFLSLDDIIHAFEGALDDIPAIRVQLKRAAEKEKLAAATRKRKVLINMN